MNLIRRFFAIACICNAGLAVGQQFAYQEQPVEAYPMPSEAYPGDGGYAPAGDGAVYYESGGDASEPGCFENFFDACTLGGWAQFGYHNFNSPARFNNHADRVNLHQMWLYAEKETDGENGFDIGGRVDYVYGVDAQDTQSFGLDNGHWDNDWDNGIYGSAIPQLYGEVAYGKTSVKVGHFFTLIGYEVVTAPDNFFYSHAYTMYNSEPFTHSGALVTHEANEFVTVWGGYAAGWDSGFEDNGDIFLGGMSFVLTDNLTVTYTNTTGRFNESFSSNNALNLAPVVNARERGQMHSIVASSSFDKLGYVMQIDRLDSKDQNDATVRDTFGINNYFMYQVLDELAAGMRFEWWNVLCGPPGDNCDVYALTFGLNVTPTDYIKIRPEIRWDWDVDRIPMQINEQNLAIGGFRQTQATFGIDAIVTF